MSSILLTIGVTAHNEKYIAHKTMRSVFFAASELEKAGGNYEIVVNIDDGDKTTKKYFSRYANSPNIKVYLNNFRDLGESRNFIVSKARGKYISFIDADDLISSNWYVNSIKRIEKEKKEVVVHPATELYFGICQTPQLFKRADSKKKEEEAFYLFDFNQWSSVVTAKKEVFKKFKYKKITPGFDGYEDYDFNLVTTWKGIRHVVADGTTLFYRQKGQSDSMRLMKKEKSCVQPYADLFDYHFFKKLQKPNREEVDIKEKTKYEKFRDLAIVKIALWPIVTIKNRNKVIVNNYESKIDNNILNNWKEINEIEHQLYPTSQVLSSLVINDGATPQFKLALKYKELTKSITADPQYVFIAPWIITGGADKVLLNYVGALKQLDPSYKICVIATEQSNNEWRKKLPKNVDFVDFGNIAVGCDEREKDLLFSRLIVQLKCKRIHIINSRYGFLWAHNHKELLRNQYQVNVSNFYYDFINGTNLEGKKSHADPMLAEIMPIVNKVFTDSKKNIEFNMIHNGFEKKKLKVHYQPVREVKRKKKSFEQKSQVRILWASRIASTKIPEVLCEIGKKLDHKKYLIDVYGNFSDGYDKRMFEGIRSINYKGTFKSFDDLKADTYDIMLYTSLSDGVPNVLLEGMASGLPIIASDVGGIPEIIIDNKTGVLVRDYMNADEYVEKIKSLSFLQAEKLAKRAVKQVETNHSWNRFLELVRKDILEGGNNVK